MRLDAWLFRAGEVLALLAIYVAAGGPTIWNGGGLMGVAMALMAGPVLYRGIRTLRRPNRESEVSA